MHTSKLALACAVALAAIFSSSTAHAAVKSFEFPNNTGQAANDLHIEFKQGVTAVAVGGKYGAFDNYNSSPGSSSAEFDGGSVPAGGKTKIRFSNGGPKITIKKWWWTKDGTRIGIVHKGLASAALSLDQTDLIVGETATLSAEAMGDDQGSGDFLIDAHVILPDLSQIPLAPILLPPSPPGMTCSLQALVIGTGGMMPGLYEVSYVAQDLGSGLVTEGSSYANLGNGCAPNEE